MTSKKPPIIRGRQSQRELDLALNEVLVYIKSALALDEKLHPRQCDCGCGETEELQSGWSGDNLIYLCPAAAREANHPKM